jgi:hypothetical protein
MQIPQQGNRLKPHLRHKAPEHQSTSHGRGSHVYSKPLSQGNDPAATGAQRANSEDRRFVDAQIMLKEIMKKNWSTDPKPLSFANRLRSLEEGMHNGGQIN